MSKNSIFILFALGLVVGCGEVKVVEADFDAAGENQGISIQLVSPSAGPLTGGTAVTLLGSGFDGDGISVLINGRLAIDVEVLNKGTLTFRTPASTETGPVEIRVFGSTGFGALADAFNYADLTTLLSVVPPFGSPAGGNTVTIKGSGFQDGQPGTTRVTLSGQSVASVVVDDSTMTFTAPAGVAFTSLDLRIENRNGSAELFGAYGYSLPGLLVGDAQGSQAGRLYFVDPATAEATVLRDLPRAVTSLLTRSNGKVIAGTGALGGIAEIGLFDDTFVDVVTMASPLPDMTELPDGKILGFLRRQNTSVILDLDSDFKGPFQGPILTAAGISGCGLAATPDGKIHFAGHRSNGTMQTIVDNALVDEVLLTDPSNQPIMAMTFFDGQLYAIRKGNPTALPPPGGGSGNGATLVTIDLATGVLNEIGALPPRADALTVMPGLE